MSETSNNSTDPIQDALNSLMLDRMSLEDKYAEDTNPDGSNYRRPGTFIPDAIASKYLAKLLDESFRLSGHGGMANTMQLFLSRLDRHGTALVPLNSMNKGFTFITRPRLNLTTANLRQNPVLNTLHSSDPRSVSFMIRALLDSRMSTGSPLVFDGPDEGAVSMNSNTEVMAFANNALSSPLFDVFNPFLVPVCNGLKGISGFPDFNLEVETTEGDFHNGDFSFVKGGDMNNRTSELSLEFRDTQGSIILSIFYYWCYYMALQAKGVVMAYPDDIYLQRLNYTVSIYRFVTDPSRKQILWWAKATGCFPKSAPVGALFNVSQDEVTISSAANFSIPFAANDVKINDPGIILDFNELMRRYCPNIEDPNIYLNADQLGEGAGTNFIGLPFIETDTVDDRGTGATRSRVSSGMKLVWRTRSAYLPAAGLDAGLNLDTGEADNGEEWTALRDELDSYRFSEMSAALDRYSGIPASSSTPITDTDNADIPSMASAASKSAARRIRKAIAPAVRDASVSHASLKRDLGIR